jgi:hypothetical protein
MRQKLIVALIAACAGVGLWGAISVIDRDTEQPAAKGSAELTGLGSAPHLAIGADPQPGEQVLAEGRNWTLVITPRQELWLRRPGSASTVSDYTRPVTLNEASTFAVRRSGGFVTLVAGPVHEDAEEVVIETERGAATDARLLTAHDTQWFFAEVPGRSAISAISAHAEDGEVVDEYTLPPMPPDGSTRALAGKGTPPPLGARW